MKKSAFTLLSFLPLITMAHSGHGPVDGGMAHYVLSPVHAVFLMAAALLAYGIYKYVRSEKNDHA